MDIHFLLEFVFLLRLQLKIYQLLVIHILRKGKNTISVVSSLVIPKGVGRRRRREPPPAAPPLFTHDYHIHASIYAIQTLYRHMEDLKPPALLDQQGLFSAWYIRLLHILGIRPHNTGMLRVCAPRLDHQCSALSLETSEFLECTAQR